MSRPIKCFTLEELKRILPSFKEEYVETNNEKVKEILKNFFYNIGADTSFGISVQKGFTTRNAFKEEDSSVRFIIAERLDEEWIRSPYASNEAKLYTNDKSLIKEMKQIGRK